MMGSFLTRAFIMALGYAYPAYECFKTVEKNRPDIEQLRFWCQYWILVAVLTVFERVGDTFISWLPLYSEAKLAFFIYLWYPRTKGTTYVYNTFLRPYVAKHETEIDRNLLELRARAGDIVVLYWQRAATYGQTRFFEILQYVAAQSQASSARPAQKGQQQVRQPPITSQARQPTAAQQQQPPNVHPPPSPIKKQALDSKLVGGGPGAVASPVKSQAPASLIQAGTESNSPSAPSETKVMQVELLKASTNVDSNPPTRETVMEETIRQSRGGRLRKTRAPAADPAVDGATNR